MDKGAEAPREKEEREHINILEKRGTSREDPIHQ